MNPGARQSARCLYGEKKGWEYKGGLGGRVRDKSGAKRSKETPNICIKMYVLTLHMISKGLHALRQALFWPTHVGTKEFQLARLTNQSSNLKPAH